MVLEILDIHRHCWPSQQGRKEGIHEYERCTWRITAWLLYGCHYQFSTELCRACVDVRNASLGRSEAHIAQNGKIGRAQKLPPSISSRPAHHPFHLLGEHDLCTFILLPLSYNWCCRIASISFAAMWKASRESSGRTSPLIKLSVGKATEWVFATSHISSAVYLPSHFLMGKSLGRTP